VPDRVGAKSLDAMLAAEMVSPASVVDRAGGGSGDHIHAADGVFDRSLAVVVWVSTKDWQRVLVRIHRIEIPLAQASAFAVGEIFIQRSDFLRSSLSQTLKKAAREARAIWCWDSSRPCAARTKAG